MSEISPIDNQAKRRKQKNNNTTCKTLLEKYQEFQTTTEIKQFDIQYMALGLGGEVGEVQNEIKKLFRDDDGKMTDSRKEKLIIELGDVMWYLTGICKRLNCSLKDILDKNIDKLS
jgi:NTP pyrophosphatase (non-canonical NTP hydrolase)